MESLYLIIECGHEGIESILFPTQDPEEAKEKVIFLRKSIIEAKAKRHSFGEDKWKEMMNADEITWEEYERGEYGKADSYCAQKWNGQKFVCCCPELGVEPSEPWLM